MSEISKLSNFFDDGDDRAKSADCEMNAEAANTNILSNYKDVQKLESFANLREVGQLKKHLSRIEEIYIGLAKSWKDSEENQEHVIIYLEDQLKVAKSSLIEYQITGTEELNAIREQMKELQESLSKQHAEDIVERSKIIKEKEATEQSLSETKGVIAELNTNLTLQKRRVEQAINELNKRTKELNSANQEISFLKIQLEAEKNILKSTVKNHDQVLAYLKEQLNPAEGNRPDNPITDVEDVQTIIEPMEEFQERITIQHKDHILELSDVTIEITEEANKHDKDNDELMSAVPENKDEIFQQSPLLAAQKTREQLRLRLQGLQVVSELDKHTTELNITTPEISNVKAQLKNRYDTSKVTIESQDQTLVDESNSSIALNERGERDKGNKNISAASEKTNRFW